MDQAEISFLLICIALISLGLLAMGAQFLAPKKARSYHATVVEKVNTVIHFKLDDGTVRSLMVKEPDNHAIAVGDTGMLRHFWAFFVGFTKDKAE